MFTLPRLMAKGRVGNKKVPDGVMTSVELTGRNCNVR